MWSHMILMAAMIGTASSNPGIPQSQPQSSTLTKITTG
jgi:hypothetical protein